MKTTPPHFTSLPPPWLFLVFLLSSCFLLPLRQGCTTVTYCFVHKVICYFNNSTKKKKKTWCRANQAVTFSFAVGFGSHQTREEPEAGCTQVTFLNADPDMERRTFYHQEQRLRGSHERAFPWNTLVKCSHPSHHTWPTVKTDWRGIDLPPRRRMRSEPSHCRGSSPWSAVSQPILKGLSTQWVPGLHLSVRGRLYPGHDPWILRGWGYAYCPWNRISR